MNDVDALFNARLHVFENQPDRISALRMMLVSSLAALVLSGCASGRAPSIVKHARAVGQQDVQCQSPGASTNTKDINRKNAIFVHPGMIWFSERWDDGPIVQTGTVLRDEGYAGAVVVVEGRDPQRIYERMLSDPGTQFVGLHYSLGGSADLLARVYDATKRASEKRGTALRYHAVMVDPFDIGNLGDQVDMTRDEVGAMVFILSAENGLLRGDVAGLATDIAYSPKVAFVYAEDVGEKWGHFSVLPTGHGVGQTTHTGQSGEASVSTHKTMAVLRNFLTTVQNAPRDMPMAISAACLLAGIANRP